MFDNLVKREEKGYIIFSPILINFRLNSRFALVRALFHLRAKILVFTDSRIFRDIQFFLIITDNIYSRRIGRTGFLYCWCILLVSKTQPNVYPILNVYVVFNKRIRVPICLEPRNPDSGQSARALIVPPGDSPTPLGAMNLLLHGRPEIAIYPTISFCLFASFHRSARKVNRKDAFSADFWKCDHVPLRIARAEFLPRIFSDRSLMRSENWYQIDTENFPRQIPVD